MRRLEVSTVFYLNGSMRKCTLYIYAQKKLRLTCTSAFSDEGYRWVVESHGANASTCEYQMFWSVSANAQADLSLRCAHIPCSKVSNIATYLTYLNLIFNFTSLQLVLNTVKRLLVFHQSAGYIFIALGIIEPILFILKIEYC